MVKPNSKDLRDRVEDAHPVREVDERKNRPSPAVSFLINTDEVPASWV